MQLNEKVLQSLCIICIIWLSDTHVPVQKAKLINFKSEQPSQSLHIVELSCIENG